MDTTDYLETDHLEYIDLGRDDVQGPFGLIALVERVLAETQFQAEEFDLARLLRRARDTRIGEA